VRSLVLRRTESEYSNKSEYPPVCIAQAYIIS